MIDAVDGKISPTESHTKPLTHETNSASSGEKLKNTLIKRLSNISQETTATDKGEQIPTKRAEAASNLLTIINGRWEDFTLEKPAEIKVEYEAGKGNDTTDETKAQKLKRTFQVSIFEGQLKIEAVIESDGTMRQLTENEPLPNLTPQVIVHSYLKTVFPNLTDKEVEVLSSTVLGQEHPVQIEALAHSLGYITRDDLAEILGIPKNPEERKKFLEKPENKKYQKVAEKIYGTEESGLTAIPEIPDAQDIIKVLETAGITPQENLQKIKEKIKEHFKSNLGENNQTHPVMQLINQLEAQIGENKTLAEIITTHYSTIESGEIPKDNLQELLPAIKNLYYLNGNINEQKAKELKEKITKTGKTIGIGAALILAIMLWRGMVESQGGSSRGMPGM